MSLADYSYYLSSGESLVVIAGAAVAVFIFLRRGYLKRLERRRSEWTGIWTNRALKPPLTHRALMAIEAGDHKLGALL